MQTSFVECIRKSVKWYRKLFFHMLDLLILNSYLLYKMETGKRCVVCAHTNRRPKKTTDSRYMCKDCDVDLCVIGCFEKFHTLVN
jgi:hypothetical protein